MVKYLTSFQVGIFNSMETKPTAINKMGLSEHMKQKPFFLAVEVES
jgi:hypothetical protein